MRPTSFDTMQCSLARALAIMGHWWSPLIIRDIAYGGRDFDELVQSLSIPRATLSTRLKALMEAGVVTRSAPWRTPRRFHYGLSDSGRDLYPVLLALTSWGDRWACPDGKLPMTFFHKACGAPFRAVVTCSHCGGEITLYGVNFHAGPAPVIRRGTLLHRSFIAARQTKAKWSMVIDGEYYSSLDGADGEAVPRPFMD